NYPNPFNPETKFNIYIDKPGRLTSILYDISGREVQKIFSGYLHSGEHSLLIDGRRLSSGVYVYMVNINGNVKYNKCILLK
ncbi:T9SS type A sorting domain-containing protein, partial [bacterium]|nr:T9SS type A sorting domain-containing protein [bacterium]